MTVSQRLSTIAAAAAAHAALKTGGGTAAARLTTHCSPCNVLAIFPTSHGIAWHSIRHAMALAMP